MYGSRVSHPYSLSPYVSGASRMSLKTVPSPLPEVLYSPFKQAVRTRALEVRWSTRQPPVNLHYVKCLWNETGLYLSIGHGHGQFYCPISPVSRGQFYCLISPVSRGQFYCPISPVSRGQFYCLISPISRGQFYCPISPVSHGQFYNP